MTLFRLGERLLEFSEIFGLLVIILNHICKVRLKQLNSFLNFLLNIAVSGIDHRRCRGTSILILSRH